MKVDYCPINNYKLRDDLLNEIDNIDVSTSRNVYPGHQILLFNIEDDYSYEFINVTPENFLEIRRKIQNTIKWLATHDIQRAIDVLGIKL